MAKKTTRTQKGQQVPELTEDAARAYLEGLRWPHGPACPHCGSVACQRLQGESTRPGVLKCKDCRKQFTVTVGTVFEDSHIPLAKWVKAFHLMCASKKGISALQLQRNLGLGSYRTAWHMAHRIRFAMQSGPFAPKLTGTVEVDECYVGGKPRRGGPKRKPGRGTTKAPVLVLVERDGSARSHPVDRVDAANLKQAIAEQVDQSAAIHTDELGVYKGIGKHFDGGHHTVHHGSGEYSRDGVHTNTAESYFSLLKRGVYGTFHHVSKRHLHRYCDEFSFRWNVRDLSDVERREAALRQSEGKRLMYRPSAGAA